MWRTEEWQEAGVHWLKFGGGLAAAGETAIRGLSMRMTTVPRVPDGRRRWKLRILICPKRGWPSRSLPDHSEATRERAPTSLPGSFGRTRVGRGTLRSSEHPFYDRSLRSFVNQLSRAPECAMGARCNCEGAVVAATAWSYRRSFAALSRSREAAVS